MAPLMNKDQLAARLNVPRGTVDRKVAGREWPFTKVGRHVRFSEEDFAEIVRMGKQQPTGAKPKRAAQDTAPPALRVVQLGHPPSGPGTPPPPPRPNRERVA